MKTVWEKLARLLAYNCRVRIGLCQINTTVGDLDGNAALILKAAESAREAGCDFAVFPELATTGYPPLDLLFKKHFIEKQLDLLHGLIAKEIALPAFVGFVNRDAAGFLFNAAAFVRGGIVSGVTHKTLIPTYDVFDELRFFKPATCNEPISINGTSVGVTICEDIWDDGYEAKVVPALAEKGADLIINLSSSPFHAGKLAERIALAKRHTVAHAIPLLYCNLVGAQDELIFDGESFAVDGQGRLVALGPQFEESLVTAEISNKTGTVIIETPQSNPEKEIYGALTLGVKDYFRKTGFGHAVIGLSGGIDSAVVGCIAANALGPENVTAIAMPSKFTADYSNSDARELAENLGINFIVIPIEESIEAAKSRFKNAFGDYRAEITAENLQARERGKILMEFSNDRNALVLATGNKTEYALGYSTLYGDMCGSLAVIGDISKPEVYALAKYINDINGKKVIPERIIERPPSAELRENQVDPFDYDRISPLTDAVVEEHLSKEQLMERGYSEDEIERVFRLVRLNEYKRRQAAPILRVTKKAFGIGRKMPIVNKFTY